DAVRRDLRASGRLSAVHSRPSSGRSDLGARRNSVPHGRDGEVRARDVLLQRRRRGAVQGRGARARAKPEGGDLRSRARDERVRRNGRAVQGDLRARLRFHPVQLRQRRHGWPHGRDPGSGARGGNGGRMSVARADCGAARRCARARHGGSRQLRDDDRPRHRRAAHGTHDEPGATRRRRSGWRSTAARWRRAARRGTNGAGDARRGEAHRDDRNRPQRDGSRIVKLVLAATCLCFGVLPLAAQVGSEPEKSPYQDFTFHQDLEVFGGYFGGNSGEANVGPLSSSLAGVRYGLHVGGPAELSVRLTRASSTRNVLNPLLIGSARNLGTESDALWIGDVAINLALTGQKSWHHLIPVFGFGGGFVKSSAAPDIGAYSFGTSFAIQFGGGIKFVTHGPFG